MKLKSSLLITLLLFPPRFGVCCLLAKNSNETAVTSNVNNTYFQNPEFDSAYKGTSAITYTIEKEKSGRYI